MLRALSRVTSHTRNTLSTLTPPKMTSLTLLAVSAWATLRKKWIPTSDELLATSEHAVLSHLTSPFRSYMVKIDGNVVASKEKELMINTIHLQKQHGNNSPDDTHTSSNIASTHVDNANPESHDVTLSSTSTSTTAPIVLLHGYGAGVGLWFMNLDDLADDYDDVYAIDFLGCGRSSRPSFHPKTVTETETFFVESLEAWRRSVGLSRMILTGHSFGGYMASVYALRYPQHVERLVLVSPMGIPPAALFDDNRYNKLSFGGRTMYNIFNALWWLDVTPQSIVRWLGPYGSGPVTNYVNKRFLDNMPDKNAVATYCYHLCAAPGSGEYALMRLLSSRIQAYDPLNKRLHQLADANRHVPTTFIYGTSDWMFSQEAVSVVNQLRTQARTRAAAQLIRIHDAGHQLMLDNPLGFRDAMRIATGKGSETDKVMIS